MYKVVNNIAPTIVSELSSYSNVNYNLRSGSQFHQPSANTVWNGQETISYLRPILNLYLLSKGKLGNGSPKTFRVGYVKTSYLMSGLFNTPCCCCCCCCFLFTIYFLSFFLLCVCTFFFFGFDTGVFLVDIN